MTRDEFDVLDIRVRDWTRANYPDTYYYSAAASWYRHAVDAGIITKQQETDARLIYGDSFDYTGD